MHAKNKLQKYEDLKTLSNVFDFGGDKTKTFVEKDFDEMIDENIFENIKKYFDNDNPIILELGCGSGDYSLALARKYKDKNFIGIDIKGARLWTGAKLAQEDKLKNVLFIRTRIDFIDKIFPKNSISEIWITFPDPQMKYSDEKHRLVGLEFLKKYKNVLKEDGIIHLKTDSEFLHGYLLGILKSQNIHPIYANHHIYKTQTGVPANAKEIQTYYEKYFISQGKDITYICTKLDLLQ